MYLKTNLVTFQFHFAHKINCNKARKSVEVKAFAAIWDRRKETPDKKGL